MKKTGKFRSLIESREITMIPGVADSLSAKLAEKAGFKAVFLSGYAASATLLGAPDVGLLTMTEMAECARRIAAAVEIPVFADGDNGHGNATNVVRTMREFERAGVAAIFFEDQVSPKRCGHMSGKQVIPCDEMVAKVRAAVEARVDPDMLIMARTDALAVNGMDDAIERMHKYVAAGADMSFVESPESIEQMRRITREIPAPNMANMVPGGKTPSLTAKELEDIGFAIVAYPTMLTYTVAHAAQRALAHSQASGTTTGFPEMMEFQEFNRLIGLGELRDKESKLYQASR
ncbi:MAG TPA: isocitrate lyase/PEP mutase family protein [Bryobacteraceae bacterium]|nr:isocitrate lyase/PEP mutase family protein [Bryobacteraceae bacterium]